MLRKYFRELGKSLIFCTLFAFFLAFAIWLFVGVVMGLHLPRYLVIVRWTFIVCFGLDAVQFTFSTLRSVYLLRRLARVWAVPYNDIFEGFVTRNYRKEKPLRSWGKEEFVRKLSVDRSIESVSKSLAEVITNGILGRGR